MNNNEITYFTHSDLMEIKMIVDNNGTGPYRHFAFFVKHGEKHPWREKGGLWKQQ